MRGGPLLQADFAKTWHSVGIIVRKRGPTDAHEPGSPFPTELYVEEENTLDVPDRQIPPPPRIDDPAN
jgi:hypothetical protein